MEKSDASDKRGVNISDFPLCIDLFLCYGPSLELALEMQAYLCCLQAIGIMVHVYLFSTRVTMGFAF